MTTTEVPNLAHQLQTNTAAESIAAAKRELASYKAASHATALRAVTAARNALETVDQTQATESNEDAQSGNSQGLGQGLASEATQCEGPSALHPDHRHNLCHDCAYMHQLNLCIMIGHAPYDM